MVATTRRTTQARLSLHRRTHRIVPSTLPLRSLPLVPTPTTTHPDTPTLAPTHIRRATHRSTPTHLLMRIRLLRIMLLLPILMVVRGRTLMRFPIAMTTSRRFSPNITNKSPCHLPCRCPLRHTDRRLIDHSLAIPEKSRSSAMDHAARPSQGKMQLVKACGKVEDGKSLRNRFKAIEGLYSTLAYQLTPKI